MLLALGEKDNIKGLESKATTRAIYEKCGIDAKDSDKGGIGGYGTKKAFETEKAAALNPDLIVLPYSLKDSADEISTACSSPVIVVNPESNQLMSECITLLGKVTRNDERATQLNSYIENSITTMQSKVDSSTPTVYLAGTSGIVYTAGAKMYQNALITNSKATNVAASVAGSSWAEVSYETILSYNPDVIVISSDSSATVESVLADSNLSTLSAITNQKVYKMPSSYEAWDSPVPSAFLGTLWLAATYHTGYSMDEFNATTKEFYKTFYGIND
jgi:iron complex transport system substrate-binding protein